MAHATSRRLDKNIGWANQNVGEQVVKSEKCMGFSQLLGACARAAPPKSTPMVQAAVPVWMTRGLDGSLRPFHPPIHPALLPRS